MNKEEERKNEIVEIWMEAWTAGSLGVDYGKAREFRDYWVDECPGLSISSAYNKFKKEHE